MSGEPTNTSIAELEAGDRIELRYNLGVKTVESIDTDYGRRFNTPGPTWAVRYTDGRGNAFAPSCPIRRLP